MKKLLLFLAITLVAPLSAVSSEEFKTKFKQDLYGRQEGLMAKDAYYKLIDPFLKEAATKLVVLKQVDTLPEALVNSYASLLLKYNVLFFHNYVKPRPYLETALEATEKALSEVLEDMKKQSKSCNDLSVWTELTQTLALFKKANVTYYKKLGMKNRALLRLSSLFSFQVRSL